MKNFDIVLSISLDKINSDDGLIKVHIGNTANDVRSAFVSAYSPDEHPHFDDTLGNAVYEVIKAEMEKEETPKKRYEVVVHYEGATNILVAAENEEAAEHKALLRFADMTADEVLGDLASYSVCDCTEAGDDE